MLNLRNWTPIKESPKTLPSAELYQKKMPPPVRLLTLPFGLIKETGKIGFSEFHVLHFRPIFSLVGLFFAAAEK